MPKDVAVEELATERMTRIGSAKRIDCRKDDIEMLARFVGEKLPDEQLTVSWEER